MYKKIIGLVRNFSERLSKKIRTNAHFTFIVFPHYKKSQYLKVKVLPLLISLTIFGITLFFIFAIVPRSIYLFQKNASSAREVREAKRALNKSEQSLLTLSNMHSEIIQQRNHWLDLKKDKTISEPEISSRQYSLDYQLSKLKDASEAIDKQTPDSALTMLNDLFELSALGESLDLFLQKRRLFFNKFPSLFPLDPRWVKRSQNQSEESLYVESLPGMKVLSSTSGQVKDIIVMADGHFKLRIESQLGFSTHYHGLYTLNIQLGDYVQKAQVLGRSGHQMSIQLQIAKEYFNPEPLYTLQN